MQNHGIRVFLLAGTFGGTGSGSYERVKQWLLQIADELGVHLDIIPFLLVPGAHGPKDPANSYANTFAVVKELAADGTGYFWKTQRGTTGPQRAGFRAPFLISDINNAPGAPRVVSESAFAALAGDIIYELATTALGSTSMRRSETSVSPGTTLRLSASPARPGALAFRRSFST